MNKLPSLIVIEILATLAIYGICAFITWSINPSEWGVILRVVAALFWALATTLIAGEWLDTKK